MRNEETHKDSAQELREKVSQFELPVEDSLWAAIEQQLDAEVAPAPLPESAPTIISSPKKRPIWLWWLLSGIILALIVWWYLSPTPAESIENSKRVTSVNSGLITSAEGSTSNLEPTQPAATTSNNTLEHKTTKSTFEEHAAATQGASDTKAPLQHALGKSHEAALTEKPSTASKASVSEKSSRTETTNPKKEKQSTPLIPPAQNKPEEEAKKEIELTGKPQRKAESSVIAATTELLTDLNSKRPNSEGATQQEKVSETPFPHSESIPAVSETNQGEIATIDAEKQTPSGSSTAASGGNNTSENDGQVASNLASTSAVSSTALDSTLVAEDSTLTSQTALNDSLAETMQAPLISPLKEEKQLARFSLLGLAGGGISYRFLSSDLDPELIEHKNQHERYGRSFNVGFEAQYTFSNSLFVRTGLDYSTYSERYDFNHDIISHTTVNDYKYLQIPVWVGYPFRTTDKRVFSVLGGVSYNTLRVAQSSWVDPNQLTAVAHSNGGSANPFARSTFTFQAGVNLQQTLTKRWDIHVVPMAQLFLNSVYQEQTGLQQRPYAFSVKVGVSRSFGKR